MATKKSPIKKTGQKAKRLNTEQELFCVLYTGHHNRELFGNATRCYMEAYGRNLEIQELRNEIENLTLERERGYTTEVKTLEAKVKSIEQSSRNAGNRLCTNPNIRARIDKFMDSMISDEFNDREMQFVISQRYDLASKVAAMREYNALKKRIKESGTHTGPITIHIAPEILAKMK